MIRYFYLILLFFCTNNTIQGQNVISKEANLFRANDTFIMEKMEYSWTGDKGISRFWDFSNAETLRNDSQIEFYSDSIENFQRVENRIISTYSLDNNFLNQTAYENRLEKINYNKAKISMKYPFQYGDSLVSDFSGKGRYCGDHDIKVEGQILLQADGYGTLVLSERDTLKNTLRVYTLTTTSIAIDMDSAKINQDELRQEIEEKYEWYVRGYRYPLYKTIQRTSYNNLEPIASKSFAYRLLPNDINISKDAINDSIKKSDIARSDDILEESITKYSSQKNIMHYNVDVNGRVITLNYTLDDKGSVNMIIADILGVVYKRNCKLTEAGETVSVTFNCSNLKSGKYVLYMNVNGKVYNEKIILK